MLLSPTGPSYEVSGRIAAPAGVVWEVLTDVEAMPTWTASMTQVEIVGGGPLAVGSAAKIRQPRLLPAIWKVDEWSPQTSFTWSSSGPGVRTVGRHEVRPVDERQSEVALGVELQGPLAPLIWRLVAATTRRYVGLELAGLTQESERRAQSGE
ncbi:polyketide cyclase [Nocardioides sp. KC13]|uniref:Polyketide cyclase n=1 Tax=Nocardioides turkmenicus TaxID=2711220 RepID=A0A6M1RHT8_9ACTN|nr:SRPBCC family protein [Nocardioides sp. KC13]NGN95767.1 polyketide cyclase [Nocardioides sp. KC13]